MRETEEAIQKVMSGARVVTLSPQNAYIRRTQHEMTLSPQNAYIRRTQHEMARAANLVSHSRGKEPRRRVRIYRE